MTESTQTLIIADGRVSGVRGDVWAFEVSGMPVVAKWLGYRTALAPGRAASSTSPLDQVRPTVWFDEWNDELLELLSVLTITCDSQDKLRGLLDRVCSGMLVPASDLPTPGFAEAQPPATIRETTFKFF